MSNSQKSLADKLKGGKPVVTSWIMMSSPGIAEQIGRSGYEAVTLDLQHGQMGLAEAREGIAALTLAGSHPIVRMGVGDLTNASRYLDLGAQAVIAPMINSATDAKAFADAAKYPPVGERSWGPLRAAQLAGLAPNDYLAQANSETLAIAMIETRPALDELDDILAVEGIDGVFVGPSDLSLALSSGAELNPASPDTLEAASRVVKAAKKAGKFAGIFCMTPGDVLAAKAQGFVLMAYGIDMVLVADSVRVALDACGES
ncbi:HpcH/HpaI aldolase family protein [Roseibium limicola]